MALTQMQLIQSLGEAMAWFEKERSWGVPPQELRHLCGRIGELYAAMITNGQMAHNINQKGYDVVSGIGERISVKTTTMSHGGGHVSFNANTIEHVDRVMILQVNYDEMQIEILFDDTIGEARKKFAKGGDEKTLNISLSKLLSKAAPKHCLKAVNVQLFEGVTVREIESGTIELFRDGNPVAPVLPELRRMAEKLSVSIINDNGNPLNTRQLGSLILKSLQADSAELL